MKNILETTTAKKSNTTMFESGVVSNSSLKDSFFDFLQSLGLEVKKKNEEHYYYSSDLIINGVEFAADYSNSDVYGTNAFTKIRAARKKREVIISCHGIDKTKDNTYQKVSVHIPINVEIDSDRLKSRITTAIEINNERERLIVEKKTAQDNFLRHLLEIFSEVKDLEYIRAEKGIIYVVTTYASYEIFESDITFRFYFPEMKLEDVPTLPEWAQNATVSVVNNIGTLRLIEMPEAKENWGRISKDGKID